MSLTESLKKITDDIPDALGIALVGTDGIVVEEVKRGDSLDFQSLGAEYCIIFKEVERASSSCALGTPLEVSIVSNETTVVMKRVNKEYFVILVLGSEGNFGKGRFLLRKEIVNLQKEL